MDTDVHTKVFIPDDDFVWVSASVTSSENGSYTMQVDDEEYTTKRKPTTKVVSIKDLPPTFQSFPLQNTDLSAEGVDDMCSLNYLHEPSILDNLMRRFKAQLPYTNTGDICVAVNPYQWLPIYTDALREQHINHFRHELRPHVYATSSSAYRGLRDYSKNQSILVSGESGAGKTETVKILMGHIAHISGKKHDSTIDKVLKANPLLESFGNAKTVRNDNSSRFGKFTQLQFDEFTMLVGSKCITYLLEKSRVISQNENERNYHIFHELFAAPQSTRKVLQLEADISTFTYMRNSDLRTTSIEGITDTDRFRMSIETLNLLGVPKSNIQFILEILAGILHLGQLRFVAKDGDRDQSVVDHSCLSVCEVISSLFRVSVSSLCEKMTKRNIEVVGEEMAVPLTVDQASDSRDALAKEIYSRLFLWLVGAINKSTASYNQISKTISLLDIFGFESFKVNRFEQLCINYANEKLQQKFTQDVFLAVQAEYQSEGLKWEQITYKDNVHVIELIEGRAGKVVGVMSILNEECLVPKGSDANLLAKLKKACVVHDSFSFPAVGVHTKDDFCITHYAGKVSYNINGFLERNRDTLPNETRLMMMESENPILGECFTHVTYSAEVAELSSSYGEESQPPISKRVSVGKDRGFMRSETIVTKFRGQLNSLMEMISKTDVQYVRCIKPNAIKSKAIFDRNMVVEQLRCAGMIEAIRITRAAYPYRVLQSAFVKRFSCLKSKSWNHTNCGSSEKSHCLSLLLELIPKTSESEERRFEVGKTKVYFSTEVLEFLENLRSKLMYLKIETIQKVYRGCKVRKWFSKCKRSIILLQKTIRLWLCREKYRRTKRSLISFQCAIRMMIAKKKLKYLKRMQKIITMQSVVRMHVCRHSFKLAMKASTKICSWVKMVQQRKRYVRLRLQKQEQKRLALKLEALKTKFKHESRDSRDEFDSPSALDSDVTTEDLSVLTSLQEEMRQLRLENDRLKEENSTLKDKERKEHFSLDSKIAVVAVGKATIQNLERERDALKADYDRIEKTLRQFKFEKQHVVENLVGLSWELDTATKELRKYKKMYDTERAIRLSQVLREREIMKHVRNLLRLRGVEYSRITEVKSRMCEIIALNKPDPHTLAPESEPNNQLVQEVGEAKSNKVRRISSGSRSRHRRTDIDGLSVISSVSTHKDSSVRSKSPMVEKEKPNAHNEPVLDLKSADEEKKSDEAAGESNWWNNIFGI